MNDVIWINSELTDACSFVLLKFTFTEHRLFVHHEAMSELLRIILKKLHAVYVELYKT